MANILNNPIFHDETKAREWVEVAGLDERRHLPSLRQRGSGQARPSGRQGAPSRRVEVLRLPRSVHLHGRDRIRALQNTADQVGGGAVPDDRQQEGRVSAHQMHRMLGVSYKSTWFMMHRLREAMRTGGLAPLGGDGKIVEADETYFGKIDDQALPAQA